MAKQISVGEYLTAQIAMSGKTQRIIAEEVGYEKPNMITMIKKGDTPLPLNKVALFAKALGVDPLHLLRLTMTQSYADSWDAIEKILGRQVVSDNEHAILSVLREEAGGLDIAPETDEDIAELKALAAKWRLRAEALIDASKRRLKREGNPSDDK